MKNVLVKLSGRFFFIFSTLQKTSDLKESQSTGKSLSEALILGSTNPQYVKRLFIDLQVQYMKTTSSEHGENMFCA